MSQLLQKLAGKLPLRSAGASTLPARPSLRDAVRWHILLASTYRIVAERPEIMPHGHAGCMSCGARRYLSVLSSDALPSSTSSFTCGAAGLCSADIILRPSQRPLSVDPRINLAHHTAIHVHEQPAHASARPQRACLNAALINCNAASAHAYT